jgi:transcriptional regulator with XRE-family HTH domain
VPTPLADHLAAARGRAGVSALQIARAAGIDPATYSRIESGENASPSFETVVRIATALGLDLQELAGEVGPEPTQPAVEALHSRDMLHRLRAQLRRALDSLDELLGP